MDIGDIILGEEIAKGGEGSILKIKGREDIVAKRLFKPAEKAAKIKAMIANRPEDPTRKYQHISIAWPIRELPRDPRSKNRQEPIGFIMPSIDRRETFTLFKLYNPRNRRDTHLNFTWEYLPRISLNLTTIVAELHRKGYVIGDLNESNFLVTKQALVTLVDCDSIQVPKPQSSGPNYFLCTVGKPEFTPPELQGRDFSQVVRTPNDDNFGLAVLIFLILMEGWHPFAAVWRGPGMAPSLQDNIQQGKFAYAGQWKQLRPPYAPPLSILPPEIQRLMQECFIGQRRWLLRSAQRPTAERWKQALYEASQHLSYCDVNPSHVYSDHLARCPWCERMALGLSDPFPRPLHSTQPPSDKPNAPVPLSEVRPTASRTRKKPPSFAHRTSPDGQPGARSHPPTRHPKG
jgi:DNA-binding helix-hairpin-helix protein with protein kinase domain